MCNDFIQMQDDTNTFLFISVNKQINDKERVAAALENPNLRELVDQCIEEQD